MLIRLYPLEYMGEELVGEDEDTEYFILEYSFSDDYMIYHKAEIFYPETMNTGYFHNLN